MKNLSALVLILAATSSSADALRLRTVDANFDTDRFYLYAAAATLEDDDLEVNGMPFALSYLATADSANRQWEYTISGSLYSEVDNSGSKSSGFGDVTAAATYIFQNDHDAFFSVRAAAKLPTAADGVGTDGTDAILHGRAQLGPLPSRLEANLLVTYRGEPQPGTGNIVCDGSIGWRLDLGMARVAADVRTRVQEGVEREAAVSASVARRFDIASYLYVTAEKGISSLYDGYSVEVGIQFPFPKP